jgi:hypothetical protein
MDVQEEEGRMNFFSLGTDHNSIPELVEEQEELISPDGSSELHSIR